MIQFHTKSLWKRIESVSKKAKAKRAAIAYVTKDLPIALQSEDVLIADCSDGAIATGQTSAKVLAELHHRGVLLYSYGHLHAKVVVLDGTVFTSSANLSESSQGTLLEAGVETDNPTAVAQAIAFIESIAEQSDPIDSKFLHRIAKIPVQKHGQGRRTGKPAKKLKIPEDPTTWMIGLHSIPQSRDGGELNRIAQGHEVAVELRSNQRSRIGWAKIGSSRRISQSANRGDSLIVIWRTNFKGLPEAVFHHCPVLLNQSEPKHHRIYYEMLPTAEKKALRWKEFNVLAKKAGVPPFSKDVMREITHDHSNALHELWESARKK